MRAADFVNDPDLAAPLGMFSRSVIERCHQAESQFASEVPQWLDQWHDNAVFLDARLSPTPEEAAAMSAEVDAVIDRYRREPAGWLLPPDHAAHRHKK
ncbi:hypothetical protein MUY14_07915 [Amycolatopsis sp. FBCC-B4732]|uniref:hypothetical protein n=1 Tax=Amycolatopsis sp. FBCC-B4732 TaxID=3079339 RepID=UPI001FF5DC6E|nr:hypothetical protein [Amycolatopsis sp. FBCC-B4732]UOX90538.1 hypothetical protein MUY14_07915 [Amycolatopsis sp. FBCC-B4732]